MLSLIILRFSKLSVYQGICEDVLDVSVIGYGVLFLPFILCSFTLSPDEVHRPA